MGIEKLASSLPKLKSLGIAKKLGKNDKLASSVLKAAKQTPKSLKLKTALQEQINSLVEMQTKHTVTLFVEDFASKKQKLIEELSKVCDKTLITQIENAKTPEQLAKILAEREFSFFREYGKYMLEGKSFSLQNQNKFFRTLTLEIEQIQYKVRAQRGKFILARERAMHVPSKNPKVIAIENILKQQYGCKFVSLKDNEELARKVLKAYETASKNGIKTPENVIASDFMFAEGENLFNGTVLLNTRQTALPAGALATMSDFHVPLHEILHGTHPTLVSFSIKKIPVQLKKVKEELSGYSAITQTHETFTELYTKKLIDGLNSEEQALFDYLNIFA